MKGLVEIDREARKESFMNNLDGRIKLISALLIIVYAVTSTNLLILGIMEVYLILLIYLSNVSPKYALKRIALVIPFGGFMAMIQPFFQPGNIIWTGPFEWLHITDYGLFSVLCFWPGLQFQLHQLYSYHQQPQCRIWWLLPRNWEYLINWPCS